LLNCRCVDVIAISALVFSPFSLAQSDSVVSVGGRILDDIRHEGVARARVTLSGSALSQPMSAYTDDQGNFSFGGIRASRYQLSIEKAGYFPIRPGASDAPLIVEAQSQITDLGSVVIVKTRAIKGEVKWSSGDPAERVVVHALGVSRGRAVFRAGEVLLAPTNERGEFRLQNLRPGRYVAYAYTVDVGGKDLKPRAALPVFYPGTDLPNVATSIDLRPVEDVSGISIVLHDTKGVDVEGTIRSSPALPEGSPVLVGLMTNGNGSQPFTSTQAQAGERFHLAEVPPGAYTLVAVSMQHRIARAFLPMQIGTTPVTDLDVAVEESKPIPGRVELELAEPPASSGPEPIPEVSLMAVCPRLGLLGVLKAVTDKHGEFHWDAAAAGETYDLSLQPPLEMYVASVKQGGREIPSNPLRFVAGADSITVVLRNDGGQISGAVRTQDGVSVSAFVALVPKVREEEHRYRTLTAGKDGSFLFKGVAPGEYELYAFDRNEEDSYYEPDYLAHFSRTAVAVKIAPHQSQSVALTRISTSTNSSGQE